MAIRISRNSIPRVNPNPRPPNEPRFKVHQAQPAAKNPHLANRVAVKTPKPKKGNRGREKKQDRPQVQEASPPPALAPPIDPRDSQYWKDLAQLTYNRDIGLKRLETEETFEKGQHQRELANLKYLEPIEVQRLRERANVGGMIHSTAHQEDLGNLAQEQFQRRSGLTEAFQRALAQRALERDEISKGFMFGEQELLDRATERQALAELERPGPTVAPPDFTMAAIQQRAQGKAKPKSKPKKKKSNIGVGQAVAVKPKQKKKK